MQQGFSPVFGAEEESVAVSVVPLARYSEHTLRGLFAAAGGNRYALIESSGATAIYREHDRLPSGEAVVEIGAESVTLVGSSGPMLIAFEQSQAPRTASSEESGTVVAATAAQRFKPPEDLEPEKRPPISHARLKDHALSPDTLTASRFTRVRSGEGTLGLRIGSLRHNELTRALGLHRGDIVMAVNGRPVTDASAMRTQLQTFPEGGEVVIDLVRRDALHRVVIPVSHG